MTMRAIPICLASLLLSVAPARSEGPAAETVSLTLPAGNAEAGRGTFQEMSCTSCHRVEGETDLPAPVSANPGPTLGAYHARQEPTELAVSIFSPSHEITATVRRQEGDPLSPMPDFTHAVTVRQFLDLIAYLRSLD